MAIGPKPSPQPARTAPGGEPPERGGRDELMRVYRLLCSPFVDEALFRASLGGGRGDIGTVGRYLSLPVVRRPILSVYFDREFYAATNPGVLAQRLDPLLHFIEFGFDALRSPHPLIELEYINAIDTALLGEPPSMASLMDMLDYDLARPSPYFDLPWYADELAGETPQRGLLRHFLTVGLAAGRQPNRWLDPRWYAAHHPDAPDEPAAALRHFLLIGDAEARVAGPIFDGGLYRRRYIDVSGCAGAAAAPLPDQRPRGRPAGAARAGGA